LLESFWWGSVFLVTLPLVVVALILAINFAPVPNKGTLVLGLAVVAVAAGIAFLIRQHRAPNPLYDLHVAGRRVFWVAAGAGIIVFGSLMGAMFVGQQFLQNVLGYSTFHAGLAILPAALLTVLVAPRSAKLVEARGARFTLLTAGYAAAVGTAIASSPEQQQISTSVESQLTKSFAGATETAQQYPQYASQITAAPKASFLQATNGPTPPGSWRSCSAPRWSCSCSPGSSRRSGCSRGTTRRTPPGPPARPQGQESSERAGTVPGERIPQHRG
jgi:hypothetical protein